jgi:hypothetical protein
MKTQNPFLYLWVNNPSHSLFSSRLSLFLSSAFLFLLLAQIFSNTAPSLYFFYLHNQRLCYSVMQTRTISLPPFKIQFGSTLCHEITTNGADLDMQQLQQNQRQIKNQICLRFVNFIRVRSNFFFYICQAYLFVNI